MAVESDKKIARLTDHSITDRKNYITPLQLDQKEYRYTRGSINGGGGAILNYILSPLL